MVLYNRNNQLLISAKPKPVMSALYRKTMQITHNPYMNYLSSPAKHKIPSVNLFNMKTQSAMKYAATIGAF